jgi:tetratricopeptide (TPR) repeat protein
VTRSFFIWLLFVLSLTVSVLAAPPALARPKPTKADKAEAAKLKKEADQLMDQDRHVDALALYAKAYDLTSDPALLYNQGRALEAMGEYPEALDKLEQFEREASPALRAKVPGLRDLIADLRGRIATLVVTTNAPNARLLVREKAVGTIDNEMRLRTRSGPATIEVVAEGYFPFKKEIQLAPNAVVKIDAQLALKKSHALVIVRSRPPADISVDGKPIGRSPLELRLSAGEHVLVAEASGRQTEKIPMTLSLGDRRELDIELRPEPKLVSRWWFWTAIGTVVAGGVALAIAVNVERSPTPGTFGDGIIPGP